MSKLTNTLARRDFLKSAAYLSALSAGGVSNLAFATSEKNTDSLNASSVTLLNQSDKAVVLNASKPVSLENVNNWVVVEINKATDESMDPTITLKPGQERAFVVDAELASLLKAGDEQVVITNEYSAVSNMIPIFTYDEQLA